MPLKPIKDAVLTTAMAAAIGGAVAFFGAYLIADFALAAPGAVILPDAASLAPPDFIAEIRAPG
jgi:hypothetical protein